MRLHHIGSWPGRVSRRAAMILVTCTLGPAWPCTLDAGQNPMTGTLTVTVVDPSGAAIAHAVLSVTRQDDPSAALWPVVPASTGVLVSPHLPAGRYAIRVDAAGFETTTANVRVAGGEETRRTVRLPLARVAETVVVDRDRQREALDPRGFSTFLSREQIEALPDDPESFALALQALAPPGAVIRIDGFTGSSLPPKSQILSIRIPRLDTFAAQDHGGVSGLSFIDLVTRPGGGRLAGSADFSFRNDALTARNPLAATEGRELLRAGTFALDGPIVRGLMSFSLSARATAQQDATAIHAALPDGALVAEPVIRPQDALTVSGRVAAGIGGDRTLRVSFANEQRVGRNLGVGATSLPERAYDTESSEVSLRAAVGGALGRRGALDVRTQLRQTGWRTRSSLEAPAVHVIEAFSAGGAQRSGGARTTEIEVAADVDYAWRAHAIRFGGLVEHGRYHSKRGANYLGTYTFASLADYAAGQPASYTRRLGDPEVRYDNSQIGIYAQDDVRVARSLLASVGVRAEAQSIAPGALDLLPRAALAWSPFRAGTTTVRAGWGVFADWLPVAVYEQSLLVDGVRQRDVLLLHPSYPAPAANDPAPSERYAIAGDTRLPRSAGMTVGIEHQAIPGVRVYASYSQRRANGLLRGRNLNAPVDGLRPDPAFGNVVEARGDAGARAETLTVQLVASDARRRAELTAVYVLTGSRTNTTGPFTVPASGDRLDTEWGPVSPTHVAAATLTARAPGHITIAVAPRWRSGTPYTITTGQDDNRDGLFTDRPAGMARNSARTPPQWEIGVRVAFVARFGAAGAVSLPSAGGDSESLRAGAVVRGGADEASRPARCRFELFASAQNVTNHANYAAVSGVLGSPFFGRPTAAARPRTIEIGARFGF